LACGEKDRTTARAGNDVLAAGLECIL
jgi:hypothetical protein